MVPPVGIGMKCPKIVAYKVLIFEYLCSLTSISLPNINWMDKPGWRLTVHSQKRTNCSKSAAGLMSCCHQADIRMHSHRLLRLDDNTSAASCHQGCDELIIKTFYPQALSKLFQQLAVSLQISSCNKSDFHRFAATWWSQQTYCNLLTTCSKPLKSTTCSKSVAFLAV